VGPKLETVGRVKRGPGFPGSRPQAAHAFYDQIIELVGVGAAAGEGDALAAIDGSALRIFFQERIVARFFHALAISV